MNESGSRRWSMVRGTEAQLDSTECESAITFAIAVRRAQKQSEARPSQQVSRAATINDAIEVST